MAIKTIAQLRTEIIDKFRADVPTNQTLPERLTEFLNNVVDSVEALFPSSTLIMSGAGVPVDYTDGDPAASGEGVIVKGGLYIDTTNGFVYRNSGTLAHQAWTKLDDVD